MSDFGRKLRTFRERAGLSQNALAANMGTAASMVLRAERGEREPRDRAWVEDAATALSLTPDERDELLVSAGHVPAAVYQVGLMRHPTLVALARFLAEPSEALANPADYEYPHWPVKRVFVEAIKAIAADEDVGPSRVLEEIVDTWFRADALVSRDRA